MIIILITKIIAGWILRLFHGCDNLLVMTLFKTLIVSRLDYGSQLWCPYQVDQNYLMKNIQRSFITNISEMHDCSCPEGFK